MPSIPKISEPFEKLLEVLSDDKFDAEEKPEITDKLVSFDEVIILKLRPMVDLMAADDLLCRLVMDALIFPRIIKKNTLPSLFVMLKFLVSSCVSFVFSNIKTFNMHTLLSQYVSKSLSSIDSLKSLITP